MERSTRKVKGSGFFLLIYKQTDSGARHRAPNQTRSDVISSYAVQLFQCNDCRKAFETTFREFTCALITLGVPKRSLKDTSIFDVHFRHITILRVFRYLIFDFSSIVDTIRFSHKNERQRTITSIFVLTA